VQRISRAIVVAGVAVLAGAAWGRPERLELALGGGAAPIRLVLVRGGTFTQGSPPTETGRKDDEAEREVTLTRDLYVAETPVTRGQFARFVGATGYRTEAEKGKSGGYGLEGGQLVQRPQYTWRAPGYPQTEAHPVALVTWADAVAFTEWASRVTGRRVRLPTEAEWEHACRAGTSTPWYGGYSQEDARALGWFGTVGEMGTHPVREKRPNGLQLHDLVGHVWQWTADWYGPYGPGPKVDPVASATPTLAAGEEARRVLRGGSFRTPFVTGRCAARGRATPGTRNADVGFRVVVEADEAAQGSGAGAAPAPSNGAGATSRPSSSSSSSSSSASGSGSVRAFSVVGGVLAAIAGTITILVLAARGRGRGRGRADGCGGGEKIDGVRAVAAEDGLRIFAPPSAAGARAVVRFRANGQTREQVVTLEPSVKGQFVYTGARPEEIVVVAAAAASATVSAVAASRQPHSSSPPDDPVPSSSSSPQRSWPSAY
jgi:formylglycine-generating enzyme required for sulfatase activity